MLEYKKRKWTEEEIEYLINNYQNKTYKQIGSFIGRSVDAIKQKMKELRSKNDNK